MPCRSNTTRLHPTDPREILQCASPITLDRVLFAIVEASKSPFPGRSVGSKQHPTCCCSPFAAGPVLRIEVGGQSGRPGQTGVTGPRLRRHPIRAPAFQNGTTQNSQNPSLGLDSRQIHRHGIMGTSPVPVSPCIRCCQPRIPDPMDPASMSEWLGFARDGHMAHGIRDSRCQVADLPWAPATSVGRVPNSFDSWVTPTPLTPSSIQIPGSEGGGKVGRCS